MSTKLLIIEDEAPLRAQMLEMLELEGFDVTEAENGGIALGLLQNSQPDLVICDIAMPDFDGYQILQHIRDSERLAQTPFIFVTARVDRSFVRHGMELGADDYLTKPFTRAELLASISSRLLRFKSLNEKNDEALESAKKKLTHMVAHELRTPLISMTMVHEVISKKLDDLSTEDMRDLLKMMHSGNQRMQHLVEQMVFFTRLNTGILNEDTVKEHGRLMEIQSVINEGIDMGRTFSYRNQQIPINRPLTKPYAPIRCIVKALAFAFAELIANAIIYSPKNTSVIIQERIIENWIHVSIVDSGPGLTTNRLQKASLPFEQIDRESQEQQGMGMGMPLAIKIIEIHGGDMIVQSTVSGGTKIVVKLPMVN